MGFRPKQGYNFTVLGGNLMQSQAKGTPGFQVFLENEENGETEYTIWLTPKNKAKAEAEKAAAAKAKAEAEKAAAEKAMAEAVKAAAEKAEAIHIALRIAEEKAAAGAAAAKAKAEAEAKRP